MHGVPGLQARRWASRHKSADLLARLLADALAKIEPALRVGPGTADAQPAR